MNADPTKAPHGFRARPVHIAAFAVFAVAGAGLIFLANQGRRPAVSVVTQAAASVPAEVKTSPSFQPTAEQWKMLVVEPVLNRSFRVKSSTEGKIAINEDRSTPIFSPYVGRVTRLAAKPGDMVKAGQPLFFIEATEMVQAQNDFLAANSNLQKARSRVALAEIVEKQNRTLFENKAGSLRDSQTAQAEMNQARSEARSSEAALEASRNRLSILGKTQDEITAFGSAGTINAETPIFSPIDGTVTQRRVGPGQYVSYISTGAVDPVFTIGDLGSVWVVAYVRESELSKVKLGRQLEFSVLAYPGRTFQGKIDYVAPSFDLGTRRLLVRATVDNAGGELKPEMFANITLMGDEVAPTAAVPTNSVIFDAESARVWVARNETTFEPRQVKTGLSQDNMIQILSGLEPGERIATKGGIFVDKAAQ